MKKEKLEKLVSKDFENEVEIDIMEINDSRIEFMLSGKFIDNWDSQEYVYRIKEIVEKESKKKWEAKTLEIVETEENKLFYVELES